MARKKSLWGRILRGLLRITIILLLTLCLVEWIYREQWIDFYSKEWTFQNPVVKPDPQKKKILVFGDSFSADANSWVNQWKNDTSVQVFNAAIPGVGPETFRLIMENRLEETSPSIVVVQLYEGNDLYDISKPVNWSAHSFGRNLFWSLSNSFRSLNFVNYRLGQAKADISIAGNPKSGEAFSPEKYDPRTRLYIAGDRSYPQSQITVSGEATEQFEELVEMLREMKEMSGSATFIVLPVPHCVQVDGRYLRYYRRVGAGLDRSVLRGHAWAERLKKEGFSVIDPIETFRKAALKGTTLYYANDPHLNKEGQTLLLKIVREKLEEYVH